MAYIAPSGADLAPSWHTKVINYVEKIRKFMKLLQILSSLLIHNLPLLIKALRIGHIMRVISELVSIAPFQRGATSVTNMPDAPSFNLD
jgi:hypothetical protein